MGANGFINSFRAPQASTLICLLAFNSFKSVFELFYTIICIADYPLHLIAVCNMHFLNLLRQSLVLKTQVTELIYQSFGLPFHIFQLRLQPNYGTFFVV